MKFQYKRIMVTVSALFMGIGMLAFSTVVPSANDSTKLEEQKRMEENQTESGDSEFSDQTNAMLQNSVEKANPALDHEVMNAPVNGDSMQGEKEAVPATVPDKGLEKNAYPEINELFEEYLSAVLEVDELRLAELVDHIGNLDMNEIQRRTEKIEEYSNLDCYTLEGPETNSYVVFLYNEMKITDINTLVSGLDVYYVRTDENGKLTIVYDDLPDEISDCIMMDMERDDVAGLIKEVNDRFSEQLEADEKLKNYFEELSVVDVLEEKEENEQKETNSLPEESNESE